MPQGSSALRPTNGLYLFTLPSLGFRHTGWLTGYLTTLFLFQGLLQLIQCRTNRKGCRLGECGVRHNIHRKRLRGNNGAYGPHGGVVVKALRYKPAGRRVDSPGVIGIFQCHNPSGHTMALGSTQPLTEMITRCISWG